MLTRISKTGIKLYWYFIPKEKRIVCLYKDHCSQHVFNEFDQRGFVAGIKSLMARYRSCDNNYAFYLDKGVLHIKTQTGEVITEPNISDLVAKGCRAELIMRDVLLKY